MKRGNAAATADRIAVFADNAEALSWYILQSYKYQTDSNPKKYGVPSQRWNIPWNVRVLASPPSPANPDDQNGAADHSTKESIFRRWESFPLLDKFRIVGWSIIADDRADGRAYPNTDEYETVLGNCEAASINKNNWECFKYVLEY